MPMLIMLWEKIMLSKDRNGRMHLPMEEIATRGTEEKI
jgi:hypothetical protein